MAERLEYPAINGGAGGLEPVVQSLVGFVNGEPGTDESAAFPFKPRYSEGEPTVDIERATSGLSFRSYGAGVNHLTLQNAGASSALAWAFGSTVATGALTATGLITGQAGLAISAGGANIAGPTTIFGDFAVTGLSTLAAITASGTTTFNGAATFNSSATFNGSVSFPGAISFPGGITTTTLTATGNTVLGDANADTHAVIGVTTYRNAANSAVQALFDAGNNRVVFGSATALASDITPATHHIGRAYFAPESANDFAIEVRRSSAASVGWRAGVDSGDGFVLKDTSDTTRLSVTNTSGEVAVTTGNATFANGKGIRIADSGATMRTVVSLDNSNDFRVGNANVNTRIVGANIGFFGFSGGSQPTINGSRGGNAALLDLLNGLAALDLIVDATTA